MDLQEAQKIDSERERRERQEQEAAEVKRAARQRAAAASFAAQAKARRERDVAERRSVVGALTTVVALLSKLNADALFRSTDEQGLMLTNAASKVLAVACARLARLEGDD